MKINDLKRYKPLDITELSGSPWNDAEKVLGLDAEDKVVMANPGDIASMEDVENAISAATENLPTKNWVVGHCDLAISAATADLASKEYVDEAVSGVTVDLSDYYTKEEVDEAISGVTIDLSDYYTKEEVDEIVEGIDPDLSNYYTKDEVDEAITAATEGLASEQYVDDAIGSIPEPDLSDYYTKEEIGNIMTSAATDVGNAIDAAVSGLASETYVDNAVDGLASEDYVDNAVTSATEGLASQQYVDGAITAATENLATEQYVDDAIAGIPDPDLSDYYTKDEVDAEITAATENMATTGWVESQGYLTEHQDLSAYAPTSAVTADIQTAIAAETARTESTYAKPADIPSLTGYSTTDEMNAAITAATATTTGWVENQNYLTQHQSLAGLFDDVEYASSSKTINFYDQGDNLVGQVDATDFIKDGMVDNVYITGSTLVISFNTDAGQEDIEIALTDIFNPANYYDKTAVDGMFAAETARTESTYLKEHQDLSDYALTTAVTQDIATAMAAETARTESTYAKPSQIPSLAGYATEAYVDESVTAATATTTGWVESQGYLTQHQDLSDYALTTAVTADIATAMASETARTEETYATLEDVYGVTASTQMEITTADTQYYCRISNIEYGRERSYDRYFKETNIPGYLAIRLADYYSDYTGDNLRLDRVVTLTPSYQVLEYVETYTASTQTLGTYNELSTTNYNYGYIPYSLDNSYDYYLIFKTETNELGVFKTLPVITVIDRTVPGYEDIPVAQDGSGKKVFVYNGNDYNKKVIANASIGFGTGTDGRKTIVLSQTTWGGSSANSDTRIPEGNNKTPGIKTWSDSDIIFDAGSALAGFTEQITLTLTGQSATDSVYGRVTGFSFGNYYLWETDNPRYEVLPFSAFTINPAGAAWIQNFSISSVTYYNETYESQPFSVGAKGKLSTKTGSLIYGFGDYYAGQNYYFILDKETMQWEFTNSLTITRAKNLQEAISAATQNMVTSGDVATQIGTAMASETARTESTYAKPSQIPSLNGYATEAWVGQQGYLTSQSLTNYYTKTEIDGMIGDIESLLASI